MSLKMNNCISVIIPTKNGGELFRESLEMIFSQEIDCQLDVIVIDSGSTDQTLEICAAYSVRLIQIPASSFGHSSTRNLGIEVAKGEICVLTVQDAVAVDNTWLAKLVEPMIRDENVAGVFGQQVSTAEASLMERCCKSLWYQEWRADWKNEHRQLPVEPRHWHQLSLEQKRQYARFDNVNSCIRKSVWQKIPLPDVSYAEDIAWAINVLSSGFSIFWQPDAKVFHSHNRSLAYEFKRSYVDMKTISVMFGEHFSLLTHHRVCMVFDWIIQEAGRFLQIPVRQWDEKEPSGRIIAEADILWQQLNQEQKWLGKSSKGHNLIGLFYCYAYRCFPRSRWFRQMCRTLIKKGDFLREKVCDANTVESSLLVELQARHHFFFNQLLQVYFTQNKKNTDTFRIIRFGAAVMVGGSLLGQYMSTMDCTEKYCNTGVSTEQNRSIHDGILWQVLGEWYDEKNGQEHDALLRLDQLLTGGV
jgi:GT2 family glycosyltransferase